MNHRTTEAIEGLEGLRAEVTFVCDATPDANPGPEAWTMSVLLYRERPCAQVVVKRDLDTGEPTIVRGVGGGLSGTEMTALAAWVRDAGHRLPDPRGLR